MTVQETLSEGIRLLKSPCTTAYISTPALDAALLLAEVLGTTRPDLISRGRETITESCRSKFLAFLERRRNGECVAYIQGRKEFRSLEFMVNPNVLVPRPDTEILVEAALGYIDSWEVPLGKPITQISVLDLCTGSGAIAVSLKRERPFLNVTALDVSPEALKIAALNASRLLENPIHLVQSNIFDTVTESFNLIVSNPPYVISGDIDTLAPEVRREPRLALDGGVDGLELIERIVSEAPQHLVPGGIILLEAAPEQKQAIRALLENNGFSSIMVHKDLAGLDRVISAKIYV